MILNYLSLYIYTAFSEAVWRKQVYDEFIKYSFTLSNSNLGFDVLVQAFAYEIFTEIGKLKDLDLIPAFVLGLI